MIIRGYVVKDNTLLIYSDKGIISLHNATRSDRNNYKAVSYCRFCPVSEKVFHDVLSWACPIVEEEDDYDYDDFPLH